MAKLARAQSVKKCDARKKRENIFFKTRGLVMRTANLVVAVLDWWLVGDVWMGSEVQSECGNARRDRIFFFFLFFFLFFF